jgi:cell division septation protein DedD
MRNNETGEFELVVGNRQLLSGFFIIVLLFAVAFAMGYVVGQNSPRSSKLETAASTTPVATPAPVPDTSRQATVPAVDATPPAANPSDSAAAAPSDNAAPAPVSAPPQAAPPAASAASDSGDAPALAPGSYWQAIAVPQADAEVIASSLKEKGLPIVLTPGTRNLTRVLVGPYTDQQSLGKAKTDLENAGFHPVLRKP